MTLIAALRAKYGFSITEEATTDRTSSWLSSLTAQAAPPPTFFTRMVQRFQRQGQSERHAQLARLGDSLDSVSITPAEQRLNVELFFASASLAVTVAGTLFYPPLRLLGLPSVIYSLIPIYRDGYRAARAGNFGVDVLYVFTQTLVAARGFLLPANLGAFYYFLSHKLLVMAEDRFRLQLEGIFGQLPTTVHKVVDGEEIACELSEVVVGDWIAVRAGETIPVDGIVVAGLATVDQQRLTGEAQPTEKGVDEPVYAAAVVLSGWLHIQVVAAGDTTIVAQIGAILAETTATTAERKLWAERLGDRTVLPLVALGALGIPLTGLDGAQAVIDSHPQRRMVISSAICTLNYLGLAADQQLLVKDGRALELLQRMDTVIFDKTGTLTLDEPHVAQIHAAPGYSETDVLRYAAAAEARQEHPIARAILQCAADQALAFPSLDGAQYHVGYGLTVQVDGAVVQVGSARFLAQAGVAIAPAMQQQIEMIWQQGHSVVLVAADGQIMGLVELHATVRPAAKALIQTLQARGVAVAIISGDHAAPTQRLATTLGIQQYFAEVLPEAKAELVAQLQATGKTVCFVGDGINDTIAMKQADVAISLRGATTAATDTAHIVLMDADLAQLTTLLTLTNRYTRNLRATAGTLLLGTAAGLSGAYFLGFGLWHVTMINMTVFPVSLGVAMWPRLHREPKIATQRS
ncbi:MAG: HAD-IC family P-type ATPase [Caldilineaceae bacterium]